MKTFCIYRHKPRGDWQVMYRTRVAPCEAFPTGSALVHVGFAPTFADAVVRRNVWFRKVFGEQAPLVTAWNLRARRARKSRREVFEDLVKASQTLGPAGSAEEIPLRGEVDEVLKMLDATSRPAERPPEDTRPPSGYD